MVLDFLASDFFDLLDDFFLVDFLFALAFDFVLVVDFFDFFPSVPLALAVMLELFCFEDSLLVESDFFLGLVELVFFVDFFSRLFLVATFLSDSIWPSFSVMMRLA